ncbi:DUF916 and DUF3324 domain-containing protein [Enterococcus sp. LJL51]|uniref:DUF916 and DUF3324 domain-containing protein n=1 Tax=Enterococcus sp. LJL51 TaxID=3416656 RepID=UPI003CEC9BAD
MNRMRKAKRWTVVLSLFYCYLVFFNQSCPVYASAETNTEDSSIGYSVQKIDSEDSESSFYDLIVRPGERKEIKARIINTASEPIIVESAVYAAHTNENGEIAYTSQADSYDESLRFKLDDFTEIQASDIKAEIPANGEKIVTAVIMVPEEAKDGVILGSWYFEKANQTTEKKKQSGIQINNKYSYALAIKLTVNKEIEQPNLNLTGITKGLGNYHKAFFANVQNDQAAIMSKMSFQAEVMKKDEYEVLYKNTSEDVIMAPNSKFSFPIFLGKDQMKAGEYSMRLIVKTQDPKWSSKTWEWLEHFTVTQDEAKKNNENAINDPQPESMDMTWLIAGSVLLFLLLLAITYVLTKKKQRKKSTNKKPNSKKSNNKKRKKSS